MAIVKTDSKYYTEIANSIRRKNGSDTMYRPEEMADAIGNIPTGGGKYSIDVENFEDNKSYVINIEKDPYWKEGDAGSSVVINQFYEVSAYFDEYGYIQPGTGDGFFTNGVDMRVVWGIYDMETSEYEYDSVQADVALYDLQGSFEKGDSEMRFSFKSSPGGMQDWSLAYPNTYLLQWDPSPGDYTMGDATLWSDFVGIYNKNQCSNPDFLADYMDQLPNGTNTVYATVDDEGNPTLGVDTITYTIESIDGADTYGAKPWYYIDPDSTIKAFKKMGKTIINDSDMEETVCSLVSDNADARNGAVMALQEMGNYIVSPDSVGTDIQSIIAESDEAVEGAVDGLIQRGYTAEQILEKFGDSSYVYYNFSEWRSTQIDGMTMLDPDSSSVFPMYVGVDINRTVYTSDDFDESGACALIGTDGTFTESSDVYYAVSSNGSYGDLSSYPGVNIWNETYAKINDDDFTIAQNDKIFYLDDGIVTNNIMLDLNTAVSAMKSHNIPVITPNNTYQDTYDLISGNSDDVLNGAIQALRDMGYEVVEP